MKVTASHIWLQSLSVYLLFKEKKFMKYFTANTKCSFCNTSIKWWNAIVCFRCGRTICRHHAQIKKRPHSFILFPVCIYCIVARYWCLEHVWECVMVCGLLSLRHCCHSYARSCTHALMCYALAPYFFPASSSYDLSASKHVETSKERRRWHSELFMLKCDREILTLGAFHSLSLHSLDCSI